MPILIPAAAHFLSSIIMDLPFGAASYINRGDLEIRCMDNLHGYSTCPNNNMEKTPGRAGLEIMLIRDPRQQNILCVLIAEKRILLPYKQGRKTLDLYTVASKNRDADSSDISKASSGFYVDTNTGAIKILHMRPLRSNYSSVHDIPDIWMKLFKIAFDNTKKEPNGFKNRIILFLEWAHTRGIIGYEADGKTFKTFGPKIEPPDNRTNTPSNYQEAY